MSVLPTRYFAKIETDQTFLGQATHESHYGDNLIEDSCRIDLDKGRSIIYLNENDACVDELLPHLLKLKFTKAERKASKQWSKLFGGVPAGINKSSHCSRGGVINQNSDLHNLLCNKYGRWMTSLLNDYLSPWLKIGKKFLAVNPIHDDYIMYDGIHTSGIINKNNEMLYHMDTENRKHMYSAMIVYKKDVSGGYLVFPEYGFAVKLSNRSVILFYGKGLIHGVTPTIKHSKNAYRFSVVFYTMDKLQKCEEFNKEIQKAIDKAL
ncbi:MAG TPA: hypothetical protein VHA56_14460 [Mucilaginibacter sp.]|nr:hypothetical protein [Mucilaginibacter sp.]